MDDKVTMVLTNPGSEPWTHTEFPALDELGNVITDQAGNPTYQEFKKGDVIQVSPLTAEHLITSGQATTADKVFLATINGGIISESKAQELIVEGAEAQKLVSEG